MNKAIDKRFLAIAGLGLSTGLVLVILWATRTERESVHEAFNREYGAYCEDAPKDSRENLTSSLSMGPRGLKHMGNITRLGPKALPYIMEKAGQTKDMNWTFSISLITEKVFLRSEWPGGRFVDSRAILQMYIDWWPKGRKLTPEHFKERYALWKAVRDEGKESEAIKRRDEISKLGIAALPMIMEKLREGDSGLIPVVSRVTREKVAGTASAEECLAWWDKNRAEWLIPFPNNQPVANAGRDREVTAGDTVQLDGSGSTDADQDELTYTWRQISGPTVKLGEDAPVMPTFAAPEVKGRSVLIFELKVNDAGDVFKSCPTPVSQSEPDTVKITVNRKKDGS